MRVLLFSVATGLLRQEVTPAGDAEQVPKLLRDAAKGEALLEEAAQSGRLVWSQPMQHRGDGTRLSTSDGSMLRVVHGHQVLHQGRQVEFDTTAESTDLHSEEAILLDGRLEADVYFKSSDLCGVGLFTQPELTCSPVRLGATDAYRFLPAQAPQRGFGVELELVARKPSEAQVQQFLDSRTAQELREYRTEKAQYHRSRAAAREMQNSTDDMSAVMQLVEQLRERGAPQEAIMQIAMGLMSSRAQIEQLLNMPETFREVTLQQLAAIPGVEKCFAKVTEGLRAGEACTQHTDCSLSEFCGKRTGSARGQCMPRSECGGRATAIDGTCPMELSLWQWTTDVSVDTMKEEEVLEMRPDAPREFVLSETSGVGFEMISPAPPNVLAGSRGLRSVAEVVELLGRMGVQAGPTQGMHVHVNVGKPGTPTKPELTGAMGADLSPRQIANVWAAYARFQHVIDEMLQDSRVGNKYAKALAFATQVVNGTQADAGGVDPREMINTVVRARVTGMPLPRPEDVDTPDESNEEVRETRRIFTNLFSLVGTGATPLRNASLFCNAVLGRNGSDTPCDERYPHVRYSQLNLAALDRLGTVEFRAFPATHDPQRALAWVSFALSFVEAFKDDSRYFVVDNVGEAIARLANDQTRASLLELATELHDRLGYAVDLSFFEAKSWITGPACQVKECKADCQAARKARRERQEMLLPIMGMMKSVINIEVQPDGSKKIDLEPMMGMMGLLGGLTGRGLVEKDAEVTATE